MNEETKMSDDNKKSDEIETNIHSPKLKIEPKVKKILKKLSDTLNIPFNEVLNASILLGFNRFWFPLQKYLSELGVEDQPVKEEGYEPLLAGLKAQIEISYQAIQKIGELEKKFTKKHPFGKFPNLQNDKLNLKNI